MMAQRIFELHVRQYMLTYCIHCPVPTDDYAILLAAIPLDLYSKYHVECFMGYSITIN